MGFEWNTLHGALEALFPDGTIIGTRGYDRCPIWSTTIFGAAAYLLERGGVYHRIVPEAGSNFAVTGDRKGPPFEWQLPNLVIRLELVTGCRELGQKWYQTALNIKAAAEAGLPDELVKLEVELKKILINVASIWAELVSFHASPIVERPVPLRPLDWWLPALKLLVICDEASQGLGFDPSHPFEGVLRVAYNPTVYKAIPPTNSAHFIHVGQPANFAPQLNIHLVRVLPKSRTPAVGCTMRTLSHNLAIVPPEGIVDLYWYRELRSFHEDREPLNILLVPLPYQISATSFKALSTNIITSATDHKWGWFKTEQTWLQFDDVETDVSAARTIAEFICELIDSAERDVGRVHAIVLPESALDWTCYAELVKSIQSRSFTISSSSESQPRPAVDFLISGLSMDETGLRGNYVATTTFSLNDTKDCIAATYRRNKHHRWQLTESQIAGYALGSTLDPNCVWWEANDVPKREINLTVFRRGAVFSAMICEDLARSEPCHEPLRDVGPNLVFVLLMDGPQLQTRWPARYATTLADDPGSSVLTLTSLGLIERSNRTGHHAPSRDIALWKDDSGQTIQISCPTNAQGVVVTLSGVLTKENTLDGRQNTDTQAWRYRGHQPVRLSAAAAHKGRFSKILPG